MIGVKKQFEVPVNVDFQVTSKDMSNLIAQLDAAAKQTNAGTILASNIAKALNKVRGQFAEYDQLVSADFIDEAGLRRANKLQQDFFTTMRAAATEMANAPGKSFLDTPAEIQRLKVISDQIDQIQLKQKNFTGSKPVGNTETTTVDYLTAQQQAGQQLLQTIQALQQQGLQKFDIAKPMSEGLKDLNGELQDTQKNIKKVQQEIDKTNKTLNGDPTTGKAGLLATRQEKQKALTDAKFDYLIEDRKNKSLVARKQQLEADKQQAEDIQNNAQSFKNAVARAKVMTQIDKTYSLSAQTNTLKPKATVNAITKMFEQFVPAGSDYLSTEGQNAFLALFKRAWVGNNSTFGRNLVAGWDDEATIRAILGQRLTGDANSIQSWLVGKLAGPNMQDAFTDEGLARAQALLTAGVEWQDNQKNNISISNDKAALEAYNKRAQQIQQYAADIKAVEGDIKRSDTKLTTLESKQTNAQAAFDKVDTAVQQAEKDKTANESTLKTLQSFEAALNALIQSLTAMKQKLDNETATQLKNQEQLLKDQYDAERKNIDEEHRNAGRNINTASNGAQAGAQGAADRQRGALDAAKQADLEAEQFRSRMQMTMRRWFGAQTVVNQIRRGIQAAYRDIQNLDKAMTNIAVVTNFSVGDLWGQINDYMAIAKQYGVTTQGVYEVTQLFYQQGLGTSDVMAATTETLKMARIAGISYSAAADGMTVAIRAFKMEMEDASHVTDVYSKVAAGTASDTQELIEAMSKTASGAANVGSSFENTTAMIATMVNVIFIITLPLIAVMLY